MTLKKFLYASGIIAVGLAGAAVAGTVVTGTAGVLLRALGSAASGGQMPAPGAKAPAGGGAKPKAPVKIKTK